MTGPTLVMIIRHGEKPPSGGGTPMGVASDGSEDKHSLTVRGWVRAGALIGLFSSAHDGVETPTKIFAACSSDDAGPHGRRPAQTVTPLAEAHNTPMDTTFAVGNEGGVAAAILEESGVVLVSWEHHNIPLIVAGIGVANFTRQWPDARFDLVWIFRQTESGYAFSEIGQNLLSGDQAP